MSEYLGTSQGQGNPNICKHARRKYQNCSSIDPHEHMLSNLGFWAMHLDPPTSFTSQPQPRHPYHVHHGSSRPSFVHEPAAQPPSLPQTIFRAEFTFSAQQETPILKSWHDLRQLDCFHPDSQTVSRLNGIYHSAFPLRSQVRGS